MVYLYMMILAGRFPLISAYFLRALAMAGHMLSFNSCTGLVCRLATLRYLVKVLFMLATTASFEGDFDSPRFSSELGVHLDGDLGGDRHQPLRLAEHSAGDKLARDRLLQATFLLYSSAVVTLSRTIRVLSNINKKVPCCWE